MKIKTRNTIFTILMFLSLLFLVSSGVFTGIGFYLNMISFPQSIPQSYVHNFVLLKCNFYAVIASIFIILIYNFVTLLLINVEFEKTQSSEIVYFVLFLCSLFMETGRLFTPLLNLWENVSSIEIYITKGLIFGRTLAPLSLLYSVIYSKFEDRQNVGQNIIGISVFSLFLAKLIPVNTSIVLPIGAFRVSFGNLVYTILLIIFIVAIISMIIKIFQNHLESKLLFGFILLIAGYFILIQSYNILTTLTGTILLSSGTFMYLKSIHKQYLWN